MGFADAAIATAVLAGAIWLLHRSLWRKRGSCHGCASAGACRSAQPAEPVRLGRVRRPGAGSVGSPGPGE